MKLSETKTGKKWLNSISPSDKDIAKKLLDELILVSNQKLKEGLDYLLRSLPKNGKRVVRSAIYVPVEAPIKKGPHPKIKCYGIERKSKYPAFSYSFFDTQTGLPHALNTQNIGSEGPLLNFLRNSYKQSDCYFISPCIDKIRSIIKENGICRIVFLDDCIGSGKRITEFFRWFSDNNVVKSWRMLKKIEFYVLSYAMSTKGLNEVKKNKHIKECLSCISLQKGRSYWSKKKYKEFESFCKRNFSKRYNDYYVNNGIGFDDTFFMVAFEHGIPNNAPDVLRTLKLNEEDFIQVKQKFDSSKKESAIIAGLSFLKSRMRYNEKIGMEKIGYELKDYLELSVMDYEEFIKECMTAKYINEDYSLTEKGKNFLIWKKPRKKSDECIEINTDFYYY